MLCLHLKFHLNTFWSKMKMKLATGFKCKQALKKDQINSSTQYILDNAYGFSSPSHIALS